MNRKRGRLPKSEQQPDNSISVTSATPNANWKNPSFVKKNLYLLSDSSFQSVVGIPVMHEDVLSFYIALSTVVSFGQDHVKPDLGKMFIFQELLDSALNLFPKSAVDTGNEDHVAYMTKHMYSVFSILEEDGHVEEDPESAYSQTPVKLFRITASGIDAFLAMHNFFTSVVGEVEERIQRLTG